MSDAARCPYSTRHWFTVYGAVGLRRPTCARCDLPNPNWTPEMEQEFRDYFGLDDDEPMVEDSRPVHATGGAEPNG